MTTTDRNGELSAQAARFVAGCEAVADRQMRRTRASKPRTKAQPAPRRTKQGRRALTYLYWTATVAPCGLAGLLLGVSMPHLADGFQAITGCGGVAGWLLAVAVDAAQVTAKLQLTLAHRFRLHQAALYTAAFVVASTGLLSMALNVMAFLAGATTVAGVVLAVTTGVLLPLLILALSYTGSCFALSGQPK